MIPKPNGLQPKYGAQFKDQSIVAAYQHRPRYPQEVFDILSALITDQPRHVLDVGCGTGFIARHLINKVDKIDAVDFSAQMIATGKTLPGGDDPALNRRYCRRGAAIAPLCARHGGTMPALDGLVYCATTVSKTADSGRLSRPSRYRSLSARLV